MNEIKNKNIAVERFTYSNFNIYEKGFEAHIGISDISEPASGDETIIGVGVLRKNDLEIIDYYDFSFGCSLSETDIHMLWHQELIPFLSKEFPCKKVFFDTWELTDIFVEQQRIRELKYQIDRDSCWNNYKLEKDTKS